jgi:hypothetical protein
VQRAAACHKRFDLCRCPRFNNQTNSSPDETVIAIAGLHISDSVSSSCLHAPGVLPTRTVQAATIPTAWHAYIAANLHFYTTLLACFVK